MELCLAEADLLLSFSYLLSFRSEISVQYSNLSQSWFKCFPDRIALSYLLVLSKCWLQHGIGQAVVAKVWLYACCFRYFGLFVCNRNSKYDISGWLFKSKCADLLASLQWVFLANIADDISLEFTCSCLLLYVFILCASLFSSKCLKNYKI